MQQDYSGQNLRGRSFKGQNLAGANFSDADIRSADFTDTNLMGANFKKVKAGLGKRWVIILVLTSWLLAGISGFFSAKASTLVSLTFVNVSLSEQTLGSVTLIVLIVFFAFIIFKGINVATAIAAGVIAFAAPIAMSIAGPIFFAFTTFAGEPVPGAAGIAIGPTPFGATFAIAGAITGVFAFAFAETIAKAFGGAKAIAIFIVAIGAIVAAGAVATFEDRVIIIIFSSINIYIAGKALRKDEKYIIIRTTATTFATVGATSFRNANLTDADFTQADIKSTDFRGATLTRTYFQQAKNLDYVRPGASYLQYANLHQVLTTGQGQEKNFDRFDMRGINLQGAYLADASFIAADLSNANFQDSDLSRAKLVQTQLDETNFTGATLTGTFIEDWNITHQTNFTGVKCEYIYMRLPTREKPDPLRKPDNNQEVFADGDFADFIQPIFDTLDLYHNQGVDPRAIAIAFKQLAENNPDAELEIVAMEKRGIDKFLLRAKTAARANKSQLSGEYFDKYNNLKALPEQEMKLLLSEKDNRISRLETMVMTALERPNFYAQTYQNQGDTMSESSENSTYNLNHSKFGGGFAGTGGSQSGGTLYDHSSNPSLVEAAAEIQELLSQLGQSYPSDTTTGKMAIATEAIKRIESDPTVKERVLSALKAGGVQALAQLLNHPAASFVISALEDWQKTKDT